MTKYYNLFEISSSRSVIYGIATIWIMFFHSTVNVENSVIEAIQYTGYIGVELFLIVSGISLYFSMTKQGGWERFFLRRLSRIMLPTFCVAIPAFLWIDVVRKQDLLAFVLDITGLDLFISGDRSFWFVTMILLCYAIFPVVYKHFEVHNWQIKSFIQLLLIVLGFNFIISQLFETVWMNGEILFRRFPVFIIGCYLGKFVYEKKEIKINRKIIMLGSTLCLCIWIYIYYITGCNPYVWREIMGLIGITTVVQVSIIGNNSFIRRLVAPLAGITFEVYLLHGKCISVTSKLVPLQNDVLINIIAAFATLVGAFALKEIIKLVSNTKILSGI